MLKAPIAQARRLRPLAFFALAALLALAWGLLAFKRTIYYEGYMGLAEVIKARDLFHQVVLPMVSPTRFLLGLLAVLVHYSGAPALACQLLYGAVLAAGSAVIYLLCRRTLQGSRLVAFCGAAFALTSTTDFTFNDAAMSPLVISVLYFLIALLLLVAYVQDASRLKLLFSCLFLNLSLWTYESALPGLFVGPVIVYLACTVRELRQRALRGAAAWAIASAPFVAIFFHLLFFPGQYSGTFHYARTGLQQLSAADQVLTTLQLFTLHLKPWLWGPSRPALDLIPRIDSVLPERTQLLFALVGAGIFAVALLDQRAGERQVESRAGWSRWRWVAGLAVLALLSNAMFARVLLSHAHYRTQLTSGMLFAVIYAALAGALFARGRTAPAVLLSTGLVFAGLRGGLERQDQMTAHARKQAEELRSIIARAPALKPGARLVLRQEGGNLLATEARYLARNSLTYLYQDPALEKRIYLWSLGRQLQCSLLAGQPAQMSCDDGEQCGGGICPKAVFPISSLVLFTYQPLTNSYRLEERLALPDVTPALLQSANETYLPEKLIIAGPVNPIAREMLWFGAEAPGEPTLESRATDVRQEPAATLPPLDERLVVRFEQWQIIAGQVCAHGWASLPGSGAPLTKLEGAFISADHSYSRAATVTERPDVALAMKGQPYDYSGFRVCLPAFLLPAGKYRFGLFARDKGKRSFRVAPAELEIPVIPR